MSRVYDFGLGGQIPDSSTNFMLHPNGRALYPIGRSPMVCEISGGIGACRPAGSLPATRAALLAADYVVVPMQAEPAVIKRSYPDVLALLRYFRADPELISLFRLHPSLLFVMTKFNTRLSLTRHELDKLAKDGVQIAAYVPAGVAAAESCLTGQSVVTYAPRSPISSGYHDLARTLVATMNARKLELSAAN